MRKMWRRNKKESHLQCCKSNKKQKKNIQISGSSGQPDLISTCGIDNGTHELQPSLPTFFECSGRGPTMFSHFSLSTESPQSLVRKRTESGSEKKDCSLQVLVLVFLTNSYIFPNSIASSKKARRIGYKYSSSSW